MKQYYYIDGEQHGPISLEELKKKNIGRDTLIWYEGMGDWTKASEVEELSSFFQTKEESTFDMKKDEVVFVNERGGGENFNTNSEKNNNKSMFQNPFSFNGRIRRTEYGISFILYIIAANIVSAGVAEGMGILALGYIPLLWFLWAQGAKRCHDLGNSGWWQIIPFYVFWLLFQNGVHGSNSYGENPKS